MKALLAFVVLTLTSLAHSAALTGLHFDSTSQVLHVSVVYQGGLKNHQFHLEWDNCQELNGEQYIAARLVDSGWDDTGTTEITQELQFDLSSLNCKPAHLTIRSGRYSHGTVFISN